MQITLETLRNKESRDALIDDLIRMMEQKHIVTVLDFIPVEERLPKEGILRPVLIKHVGLTRPQQTQLYYIANAGFHWWFDEDSHLDAEYTVIGWAEIPKIE